MNYRHRGRNFIGSCDPEGKPVIRYNTCSKQESGSSRIRHHRHVFLGFVNVAMPARCWIPQSCSNDGVTAELAGLGACRRLGAVIMCMMRLWLFCWVIESTRRLLITFGAIIVASSLFSDGPDGTCNWTMVHAAVERWRAMRRAWVGVLVYSHQRVRVASVTGGKNEQYGHREWELSIFSGALQIKYRRQVVGLVCHRQHHVGKRLPRSASGGDWPSISTPTGAGASTNMLNGTAVDEVGCPRAPAWRTQRRKAQEQQIDLWNGSNGQSEPCWRLSDNFRCFGSGLLFAIIPVFGLLKKARKNRQAVCRCIESRFSGASSVGVLSVLLFNFF